jgi:hypothetical protein
MFSIRAVDQEMQMLMLKVLEEASVEESGFPWYSAWAQKNLCSSC